MRLPWEGKRFPLAGHKKRRGQMQKFSITSNFEEEAFLGEEGGAEGIIGTSGGDDDEGGLLAAPFSRSATARRAKLSMESRANFLLNVVGKSETTLAMQNSLARRNASPSSFPTHTGRRAEKKPEANVWERVSDGRGRKKSSTLSLSTLGALFCIRRRLFRARVESSAAESSSPNPLFALGRPALDGVGHRREDPLAPLHLPRVLPPSLPPPFPSRQRLAAPTTANSAAEEHAEGGKKTGARRAKGLLAPAGAPMAAGRSAPRPSCARRT